MPQAVNEPLLLTIEVRRNTSEHKLNCCADGDPHQGAPLLIVVNGRWSGAASCDDSDHFANVVQQALDQEGVKLDEI